MRIDNQDIIRTAQQLRDEDNEQLNIRPWNRHRSHLRIPSWLVAIPAAAFIGFVLGVWTQAGSQTNAPMTALVDTVYIKVPEPQPQSQSALHATPVVQTDSQSSVQKRSVRTPQHTKATGRPLSDDQIRYDLLVKN